MSAIWGHLIGVFIVVLMIVFLGIWAWAWMPWHKRRFNEMACLPMDDGKASAIMAAGSAEGRS